MPDIDPDPEPGRKFLSVGLLGLDWKKACRDARGRFASCGSGGRGGSAGGKPPSGGGGPGGSPSPGDDIPANPTRSHVNQAVLEASRARTEYYRAFTAEMRKPAAQMDTGRVQALRDRADALELRLARMRAAAEGRSYSANLVPGSSLNRKPKAR